MIEWTIINSRKINRIGYHKTKNSLYIDFSGSETETIFLHVPEALYTIFIEVDSPDKFYDELVDGYFEVIELSPEVDHG